MEPVTVPLLAYDKTGHRVGYGKGYYAPSPPSAPTA